MYILVSNNNNILFADRSHSMVSAYIKSKFNRELIKSEIDKEILDLEFGSSVTYSSTDSKKHLTIKVTRIPSITEIGVAFVKVDNVKHD